MALTLDQVQRIAHLARVEINDAEAELTLDRINEIFLTLIEPMLAIDTQGVAPMAHAQDLTQRLRPDNVTESDRRNAFQAIAPETQDGLYLVPRVIE